MNGILSLGAILEVDKPVVKTNGTKNLRQHSRGNFRSPSNSRRGLSVLRIASMALVACVLGHGFGEPVAAQTRMGGMWVQPYVVLVNANNRTSSRDGDVVAIVRELFLKEQDTWPNLEPSTPYARPEGHAAEEAFVRLILDMNEPQLRQYWATLHSTDGTEAPPVVADPKELVRTIARDKGAFGIIAESEVEKLPAKVRVLFRFTPEPVARKYQESDNN